MKDPQKKPNIPATTLVIPCVDPGLSCCKYQLVAPNEPAKNVRSYAVYCKSWRLNHHRDGVIYACKPEQVTPVIVAAKPQKSQEYRGPSFFCR